MNMTRRNSYFPDDLPHPSSNTPATVEIHYLQCGCTVQDTPAESHLPFALYGDIVSWRPSHHLAAPASPTMSNGSVSPPRAASPTPSTGENEVVRIVDPNFCERASCGRSSVFNREWNRLWEAHNSEMKAALDDSAAFEEFKARIRREAKEVTDELLGRMPTSTA
ncbi:hypothetical protein BDZ91DRAFT_364024 [Kalaharituber pfeilii]|nr:hypothetical protein BDZ91DRAFT_364024 [Kalaharituber pfeilii]